MPFRARGAHSPGNRVADLQSEVADQSYQQPLTNPATWINGDLPGNAIEALAACALWRNKSKLISKVF